MVIPALIGAGISAAGIASQSSYSGAAINLQYQQLALQREIARQQQRIATASREDIYGNVTGYNELTNEFFTDLDPTQQSIISAQEREQLLSLTEDAGRNRDLRRQAGKRAREASGLYNKAISDYQYGGPPSEKSIAADITREGRIASREGLDQGTALIGRQAIRGGQGGQIPTLLKAAGDMFGQSLEGSLVSGRNQARTIKPQLDAAHRARTLGPAQQFNAIASGERPAALQFSNLPQTTGQTQSEMIRSVLSAMSIGGQGIQSATNALSGALQSGAPDFSALARAISGISFGPGAKDESRLYDTTVSRQPLGKSDFG